MSVHKTSFYNVECIINGLHLPKPVSSTGLQISVYGNFILQVLGPKHPGILASFLSLAQDKQSIRKSCWLYLQNKLPSTALSVVETIIIPHLARAVASHLFFLLLSLSLQSILNPATRVILLQFMSNHVISVLRTLQYLLSHSEKKTKGLIIAYEALHKPSTLTSSTPSSLPGLQSSSLLL